jgi:hypothetical protein
VLSGAADRSRADPDFSGEVFELVEAYVELELARGAADAGCRSCAPPAGLPGLTRRLREPTALLLGAMTDVTSSRWHPALAPVPRRLAQ